MCFPSWVGMLVPISKVTKKIVWNFKVTEFLGRFLKPNPTLENARNRSKTVENDRKRPKKFEISETSETCQNFRNFSSGGHAVPILRGVRGAAAPQPRRTNFGNFEIYLWTESTKELR